MKNLYIHHFRTLMHVDYRPKLCINIKAIYTRKNKTRLSLDTSLIRRKLSRINGTLRRDLAKTRLIEEQVLGLFLDKTRLSKISNESSVNTG